MSSSKKIIDIIMPNYNKGSYISQAIKSVINQSYKNWKLYVIDDNSSDNSKNEILKFKDDKRVKIFFLKRNRGPSYCRNFGIKKSKSKFIAFLDSDDYWKKNKLKLQIDFMIKKKFSFTFTDYIPIIQSNNIQKELKKTNLINTFTFNKFINNSSINTSTIILEKKYLNQISFKKLNVMEDYIFKCQLMKKTKIPFKKFPKATAVYRIIKNSRSSSKIKNLIYLWRINKKFNKLSFFRNLNSLFLISLNSIKKYGFK